MDTKIFNKLTIKMACNTLLILNNRNEKYFWQPIARIARHELLAYKKILDVRLDMADIAGA